MVGHLTHKSHVKFISFNATMLNGSLGEEGEGEGEGKTALIDQRAVAAGKNSFPHFNFFAKILLLLSMDKLNHTNSVK